MGCATNERSTRLGEVGPRPTLAAQPSGDGFLQVYSAREQEPIDVNEDEFRWDDDFGKNAFLHDPAHTSYSIYSADGRLLQQVHNNTSLNDPNPTPVGLAPGLYRIEATAEDYYDVTSTVTIPVLIESGLTTSIHLDGRWHAPAAVKSSGAQVVRLPNGKSVGWSVVNPVSAAKSGGANS